MKSLLKGTLWLAVVLLISKMLGFVYRIIFSRIAGEAAVGMYMSVYPTFIFFIALVQLGLPIAVTKLVAQYTALHEGRTVQTIFKKAMTLSKWSIIAWLPLLFFISPLITNTLLHSKDANLTLIVAISSIPVVIFSGLYRSYLQGIDKISVSAWGTLLEQGVRLLLLITVLPLVAEQSTAIIAAATMATTAFAEVASLLFSYYFYARFKQRFDNFTSARNVSYKTLLHIAIPSAGSKWFGTFTWFLEPIIFLYALTKSGLTAAASTAAYGLVSNVHIPLLLFPAFIPQALAIALIPAISSLQAKRAFGELNHQLAETMRVCSVIACLAAGGFFIAGDELASKLFHIDSLHWIKLLSPIFFFYYIQAPLNSVLQALDSAHIAMKNSMLGGCIKLLCLFVLASIPSLQIAGAIIAIGIGVVFTSFMHVASVQSIAQITLKWRSFLIPYCIFLVGIGGSTMVDGRNEQLIMLFSFFTIALVLTKQIRLSDLLLLKKLVQRFTLHK